MIILSRDALDQSQQAVVFELADIQRIMLSPVSHLSPEVKASMEGNSIVAALGMGPREQPGNAVLVEHATRGGICIHCPSRERAEALYLDLRVRWVRVWQARGNAATPHDIIEVL